MGLSAVNAAYIAGLLDGEGCLSLSLKPRPGSKIITLGLVLVITNTCKPVLEWCQKELRVGTIVKATDGGTRRQVCWRLQSGANHELLRILPQLEPYIRIKKGQVRLALEYLRSRARRSPRCAFSEREVEVAFLLRRENQKPYSKKVTYRGEGMTLAQFKKRILEGRGGTTYNVVEWTPSMDRLLGSAADGAVAVKLRISRSAVRERRFKLGIPPKTTTRGLGMYA
jgi:hypothetical protein